jgi:CheY-like chemotaxis protein
MSAGLNPFIIDPGEKAMMSMRLLIVDDDISMLTALSGVVETRLPGAVIDTATSGNAALDRIAQIDYDAIVSDIKMPGMDGLELMNRVLTMSRAHRHCWSRDTVTTTWA